MKRMILILLVLLPMVAFSQKSDIQMNDSTLETTCIINVPNANKDDLFVEVSRWIALNYRSANDVIQLSDKASGSIIAKGIFQNGSWANVLHTLQIDVKDNKVRVQVLSLICKYPAAEYPMKKVISGKVVGSRKQTARFKEIVIGKINNTIDSIESQLLTKNDKW